MISSTILGPGEESVIWSPDGESIIVVAYDHAASGVVLLRVGLDGSGLQAKSCDLKDPTFFSRLSMDVSRTDGRISFVREDATHPPDVWTVAADLSAMRQLTQINPHLHASMFVEPRLLAWTDARGRACHTAIFSPPASFGPPPWPTIFRVYEGAYSERIARFGATRLLAVDDNVHILTNRGYAVCLPDIHVSREQLVQSIRDNMAAAVEAVVKEGVADPQRLGIHGFSFGGYIVNSVVTGLSCFAAAVSHAGAANLTSLFGADRDGGIGCTRLIEIGQFKIGMPPWENPQRYIDNSPLFFLDRVNTPLLLLHGSEDILSQAWEMFNGLQRLGKTAALAVYQGEGHLIARRANIIDRWNRILTWFDKYLLAKECD
jgi:dipeptidyl aminopeptidase/acylaminoacyl peptidase